MSTSQADYDLLLARTKAKKPKEVPANPPTSKKAGKVPHTPVEADGYTFPSGAEYRRYLELCWMVKAGVIRDLKVHTKWPLEVNGELIGTYEDDANYWTTNLKYGVKRLEAPETFIVEETKSKWTVKDKWYQRAKKLMFACYGIKLSEVIR